MKGINKVLSKDLIEWFVAAIKFILIVLGFSAVLELWGIKVAPIIAGLGLFGVAIALGAQDLFKNLISGILVLVEKGLKRVMLYLLMVLRRVLLSVLASDQLLSENLINRYVSFQTLNLQKNLSQI